MRHGVWDATERIRVRPRHHPHFVRERNGMERHGVRVRQLHRVQHHCPLRPGLSFVYTRKTLTFRLQTCVAPGATATTAAPLSTDPDTWTMGVTYWIGIAFWIASIVCAVAFWRVMTPFTLVLLSSWSILCGSLVSNDCVQICSSPGHFAALALIGTFAVIVILLHLAPLIADDVSVIASMVITGSSALLGYATDPVKNRNHLCHLLL